MKRSRKISGVIAITLMSVFIVMVYSDISGIALFQKKNSAEWTAKMLCKNWEEQKKYVQTYSTDDSSRERGYKIAAAKANEEIRQYDKAETVKKENAEKGSYKEDVRKLSSKICNANKIFVDGFLKSLDSL